MIRLHTLGALGLVGEDGRTLDEILAQPKRVALLVTLALEGHRGAARRDVLLARLWPELDQERARSALRQGLYHLRRALGEGVLVNRGDEELLVAPDRLECDAVGFLDALAAGRPEAALALYRGDLLPGFFLSEAPEFEQWLERERAVLRARAGQAAAQLAETASDPEAGLGWALRALDLAPSDEVALRRLMRRYEQVGNRAAALRTYEEFAARLAEELELAPSPETEAAAARLRAAEPRGTTSQPAPPGLAAPPAPGPGPGVTETEVVPLPVRPGRRRSLLGLGTGLALVGLSLAFAGDRMPWRHRSLRPADPDRVLITPFRVSGSQIEFLREGMLDLLAAKLTGESGGLRAQDPREVLAALRARGLETGDGLPPEESARLAGQLGAGAVLEGAVVGRPERLMITASLLRAPDARPLARGSVEGPADSLPELVDRLAGQLLIGGEGEPNERFGALAATSLAALRAYLEAEAAYRRGAYAAAVAGYRRALDRDSGFALAALGLASSQAWFPTAESERQRAIALAWQQRRTLAPEDRAVIEAIAGPRYPEVSSWHERLVAWERAVTLAPARPEAWYEYGDILWHRGPLMDIPASGRLAGAAFTRALALDSAFAAPLGHLFEAAAAAGRPQDVGRYAELYLARDSSSEMRDYIAWHRATVLGDGPALARLRARFPQMSSASLARIAGTAQLDGVGLEDAEAAVRLLREQPSTRGDAQETAEFLMEFALNRGRPAEANAAAELMRAGDARGTRTLMAQIQNALYADGDTAAARLAAAALERRSREPLPSEPDARAHRLWQRCDLEQWRVWNGRTGTAQATAQLLRAQSVPAVPGWAIANFRRCAAILEAARAVLTRAPDAPARLGRLDSLELSVPEADPRDAGNLVLARLRELSGDRRGALVAARRRQNHPHRGVPFLAALLWEQGRLAAELGEREEARRALRHYLALRTGADSSRRGTVREAERLLAAVEGR
ncbi:MAG TPA: BTAD domain-containing putative transcriptional regulator [Gemmatimonadales bacterium]|nr:BTAD domain-containing putative transcriptional regulator [Gemmatimonadales bacterium]